MVVGPIPERCLPKGSIAQRCRVCVGVFALNFGKGGRRGDSPQRARRSQRGEGGKEKEERSAKRDSPQGARGSQRGGGGERRRRKKVERGKNRSTLRQASNANSFRPHPQIPFLFLPLSPFSSPPLPNENPCPTLSLMDTNPQASTARHTERHETL